MGEGLKSPDLDLEKRGLPRWQWPRAAYIHVPFCAHHCGYCDFAVVAGQDELVDRYLDALGAELASLEKPQSVETLFVGGGTPTYLECRPLERLLDTLADWFILGPNYEFSVEANPGTLTAEKVTTLAEHGVNRVSLGAQSFHAAALQVLERDHQPSDVARAVQCLRRRMDRVSLDLIFGVPGQGVIEWQQDLKQALALQPDHLSTYGLTYEKGTRLWKQKERGQIHPLDEETERVLYGVALDVLADAGFEHYEISNHARPGRRSRHNQVYWANEAYFGFGLGAARYVRGRRELNTRHLTTYLQRIAVGTSPVCQAEELEPEARARETISLNLRRAEGVERAAFRQQTGYDLEALAGPVLARHRELGLLADDGTRVYLTREGKFVADSVVADFW
jgi:oxygen-independent coproporphyrinogen-3 oxidase